MARLTPRDRSAVRNPRRWYRAIPACDSQRIFYLKLPAGHVQEWHPHSSREVILTNEAPRRNRSMGVADMGVAGFGGKPASRKVATLPEVSFLEMTSSQPKPAFPSGWRAPGSIGGGLCWFSAKWRGGVLR